MTIVLVLGCCLLLAGIGGLIGAWLGDRGGGDDLGFGVAIYGLCGIAIGLAAGAAVGSVLAEALL